MSGQKTRLGFFGGKETPSQKRESLAARTVMGHEVHLPTKSQDATEEQPPNDLGFQALPQDPPSGIPQPIPEEVTEPVTRASTRISHTGKSRFPAIARFFGRWVTGGGFLSKSQLDANEDLVPAQTKGLRTVLLVLLVATFSFFIVWLLVRVTSHSGPPKAPSPALPSWDSPQRPKDLPPPPQPTVAPTLATPPLESVKAAPPPPPSAPKIKRAKRRVEPVSKPLNPDELMPLWR